MQVDLKGYPQDCFLYLWFHHYLFLVMFYWKQRNFITCVCVLILTELSAMGCYRPQLLFVVSLFLLLFLPKTQEWGQDGHTIVCKIAQVPYLLNFPLFSFMIHVFILYSWYLIYTWKTSSVMFDCSSLTFFVFFFSVSIRLASAIQLLRLWKNCCQNLQTMTWLAGVHGRIMWDLSIRGPLLCTLLILPIPFAITRITVWSSELYRIIL